MRRTRRPTLALATTTVLLLTACTTQDAPAPAATDPGSPDAATAAPTAAPAPADEEPLAPATAACLLGTWQLDLAAMQDDLRRVLAPGGGGVEVEVAGTTTYTFADGGAFSSAVDSSSTVTMSADGTALTSSATSAGDLTGTWALDGPTLVISDVDTSDLTVDTAATLDGEAVEVPAGSAEDAIEVLPPTSSTATCGPDRLALVMSLVQDEDAAPVEVTYTLRR